MLIPTRSKLYFELLHCTIGKLLAFEGPSSINDIHVIFTLNHIPSAHSFHSINFFLSHFPVFICKWSIHGLMPIWIILFACFRLSFKKERMDCSHKYLSERATVSTVIGIKGDEFGEGTCKKVFNGRRCYRQGIQNRITNLIQKIIVLFALKFLMEEPGHANRYLFRSKGTCNFVSSA